MPIERQVAEKLHACTRTYKGGATTRTRDLVDLLLIRQHERLSPVRLQKAIRRLFDRRATHAVPERLAALPRELAIAYRREAERVGVAAGLDEAEELLADWLGPALAAIHRMRK